MDPHEFDSTVGGSEHLPDVINSFKFATSRSIEIAAMTESILRPSKTKLIFQTLPVHMRRRVMSHNCKRLPRKLREAHLEQMKKSGLPPKPKRPSRKYRRRPSNLLNEYNRRQRSKVWLETHIWHAKRFHMVERWGFKLADSPCDKAFRACYRATSSHCLINDISFYTPIQITGEMEHVKSLFSKITSPTCGLSIHAKAFTSGNREGIVHLYEPGKFPFGYIGSANFFWVHNSNGSTKLWLFLHPSFAKTVENILSVLSSSSNNILQEQTNQLNENTIKFEVLSGAFNRFRLTGPNSHAILVNSLKCIENSKSLESTDWLSLVENEDLYLKDKFDYWNSVSSASPAQMPPRAIIGLIVRDPRLSRPGHRTKVTHKSQADQNINPFLKVTHTISFSPLWDTRLCELIKSKVLSNGDFMEHITKTQLVPGEVAVDDPLLQCVPIVLIQQPGSQISNIKRIGYGSGWDIVVPSGYGLFFWQTFVMFGARPGGLRETSNLAFEMGNIYLPPDSESGKTEEKRIETELKEKYFRKPPSKRVNYIKLGVNSPFSCPWLRLLQDWSVNSITNYFVLRDRTLLQTLQNCVQSKQPTQEIANGGACLVPVYLKVIGKGMLKNYAHICLPLDKDISNIKMLTEDLHNDHNFKLRRQKKLEHKKYLMKLKKKHLKEKKQQAVIKKVNKKKMKREPSEYVKEMRDLWLPPEIKTVRYGCLRQIMGFVSQAAFSFSEAKCCGVGYLAYNALAQLLAEGQNTILVRNVCSRKYRLASFQIITNP